jgi:hypothetical protein
MFMQNTECMSARKNRKTETQKQKHQKKKPISLGILWKFKRFKWTVMFLSLISFISVVGLFSLTTYISRPYFNNPQLTNYHLRLQLIFNGQLLPLTSQNIQEINEFKVCDLRLINKPIYQNIFNSQLFQVNWEGITGGEILKYYGLNLVGGSDDILGFRFKSLAKPQAIETLKGINVKTTKQQKTFVYQNRQDGYTKIDPLDFLFKDIELVVKKSNIRLNREQSQPNNIFGIKTFAQVEKPVIQQQEFESKLSLDYDLIGNVVVFVGDSEPAEEVIIDRFNNFIPLSPKIL